jgi:hypothetical protein
LDVERVASLLRSFDFVEKISQFAIAEGRPLNKGYEQFGL